MTMTMTGQTGHRPFSPRLISLLSVPFRSSPYPFRSALRSTSLHSIPRSMTPPLLLLLFSSFLQLSAPATPSKLPSCKPKACGDLNIAYPFWLEEPGRPPCGPPSFQLKCNSSGAFLSRSSLGSYRVVSVFVENSSVHVVDENLPLATGCPAPRFNISTGLGLGPFVISKANTELFFLSNCNKSLPAVSDGFRPLPCGNKSFVRLGGEGAFYSQRVQGGISPGCVLSVVPILGNPDGNVHNYVASMNNGFLLSGRWCQGIAPNARRAAGNAGTATTAWRSRAIAPTACTLRSAAARGLVGG